MRLSRRGNTIQRLPIYIAKLRCLVLNQCATYSMMRFVCGKAANANKF